MRREFFTSIRFKVFVLYMISLFLALAFFNILMYMDYQRNLVRKIDALLDAKVQTVESAVKTYWAAQAQTVEPKPSGWFAELILGEQKKSVPPDPYDIIIGSLTDDVLSPRPSTLRIYVDVFDDKGKLIESSLPDRTATVLEKVVLSRVLAGEKVLYSFALKQEKGRTEIPVRALAKAIKVGETFQNIVRTRVLMAPIYKELQDLMWKLFLRSLFVIVLASWGSFFLVRATLRPVDQMIRTIRNIKPDTLGRRIPVPKTGDEIARLAETFNAVLEQLGRSFRAQEQIVQDISHELRTPLTVISGQIEVMVKKKRPAAEYEEMLYSTLDEIGKVRRIIDSLLLLAKFDNPDYALEMKPVDLNRVLSGILQDIQVLGREKELSVVFKPAGNIRIRGHEVHLDRLFRNLLENAVKYNIRGGSIQVVWEKVGATLKITIKDTGIGIRPEHTERIFDRFYRVDPARSSGEGFGLGLSIAKSIVEAHHGRIDVQSKVGKGTTFFIQLPLTPEEYFLPK